MTLRWALLATLLLLAGCGGRHPAPRPDLAERVPPFARVPYEPFSRAAAVAIAEREWRLFGSKVDDDPPGTHPPPLPEDKPERAEGLWQRVGDYWWQGVPADAPEAAWTGKHDANGQEFPATIDENFAWSAAFISYVMRMAGAADRFPYAVAHYTYIDAALGGAYAIAAEPPEAYAPQPGDLICLSRGGRALRFADLPARFPGHCDIVVATSPDQLDVIGGNVDDAVTLKHVPVTVEGRLADSTGTVLDARYAWFVVVRVLYAAPEASAPPTDRNRAASLPRAFATAGPASASGAQAAPSQTR